MLFWFCKIVSEFGYRPHYDHETEGRLNILTKVWPRGRSLLVSLCNYYPAFISDVRPRHSLAIIKWFRIACISRTLAIRYIIIKFLPNLKAINK
jgi:hypothetical protein